MVRRAVDQTRAYRTLGDSSDESDDGRPGALALDNADLDNGSAAAKEEQQQQLEDDQDDGDETEHRYGQRRARAPPAGSIEAARLLEADDAGGERGRTTRQSRRSSNGKLKLEIDRSSLRARRRSSSASRNNGEHVQERLFLGLQPRTALLLLIPAAALLVFAYKALPEWDIGEARKANNSLHAGMKSNGTHWFNSTVLIVSMDGFRPSYLTRNLTPNLVEISEKGLRAEYMQPIFPTITFPNNWAMQTGLYAESHGIVGNDFWDPTTNTEFQFVHGSISDRAEWWLGEPMRETVVKNGLKSANIMWPGPPKMMSGATPTYQWLFEDHVHWSRKKDQIANWLDMPDMERPQFICAYLPEVDQEGHHAGPDSEELNANLKEMDNFAASVHAMLSERNLLDIVNVIYVSDHGMTATANERVVYLDEVLGEDGFATIEHKEGWHSCGLRFKPGTNKTLMVERIKAGAEASKGGYAYYTHESMPTEYHFSNSPRIAPHYLIPEVGWAISDKTEGWYEAKGRYTPIGNHGYNNSHPDMHAIFVAHGPLASRIKEVNQQKQRRNVQSRAWQRRGISRIKRAQDEEITVIAGFPNLELYNLVTKSLLGLADVAPTNGTDGFWEQYLEDKRSRRKQQ